MKSPEPRTTGPGPVPDGLLLDVATAKADLLLTTPLRTFDGNDASAPETAVKSNEALSRESTNSFLSFGTSFSVSCFLDVWMANVGSAP